jgi:hypothetical protein
MHLPANVTVAPLAETMLAPAHSIAAPVPRVASAPSCVPNRAAACREDQSSCSIYHLLLCRRARNNVRPASNADQGRHPRIGSKAAVITLFPNVGFSSNRVV